MKKHIFFVMAAVALLLVSCKNEDITISREVSIKVNLYSVIEDFAKHQYHEGDLETFAQGDKLRVHLFVYDENGVLVGSDMKYLEGYRSTMVSSFDLEVGKYTVVATSDVATLSGGELSFTYWEFLGSGKLSELKIKDKNYMGRDDKILGVSCEEIEVASGQTSFSVDVKPAGALVVIHHKGIHYLHDVLSYELDMKKLPDYGKFVDGKFIPVIQESDSYDWRLNNLVVKDYDIDNVYSYKFVLPLGETDFIWIKVLGDGYVILNETHTVVDIQKGKTYNCVFSIPDTTCEFYAFDDNGSPD